MNEKFLRNEKEMISFGKRFAKSLKKKSLLFLEGELGTGKTTFVKGLCLGLGIDKKIVRSPSFLIMYDYGKLIHIDLYRIQKAKFEELEDFGIIDAMEKEKIKAVEWPNETIKNLFPKAIFLFFEFKRGGRYVRWKD